MRKWLQSPWFWPVVAVILLVILTRGQVLMAIGPLSKYLIPVAGGYFLYRLIKRKLKQTLVANLNKTMGEFAEAHRQAQQTMRQRQGHGYRPEQHSHPGRSGHEQPVIEICPKCGEQKKAACPDCQ